MHQATWFHRLIGGLFATLLVLPLAATGDERETLPFSTLELTEPERHFSATQECVAPEDEMRRNHMEYILHQRDETMHRGIRTRQYALEECINCHAVKDEKGDYVHVEDTRHFCSTCHTYAAVSIDCFQCHADTPVRESTLPAVTSGSVPGNSQVSGISSSETHRLLASEGKSQ